MLALSMIKPAARSILWEIVPSCFQRSDLFTHKYDFSTSHLDGLRGIAAFIVMLSHCVAPWYPEMRKGYELGQMRSILQLPIIRLVCHGSPMVVIFFLISGFVLSIKPIKLARYGFMEECFTTISSAIFRRAIRLFLPSVISTFVVAILVQLQLFNFPYEYKLPGEHFFSINHLPTFIGQLIDWADFVLSQLTNPWTLGIRSAYNIPLWTLPFEFFATMQLFLAIAGLSQLRFVPRACLTVALCIYCMSFDRWLDATVLAGMTFAELHLIKHDYTLPETSKSPIRDVLEVLAILSFLIGLFLASFPEHLAETTPGYVWLSALDHKYLHWETFGAVFIVWGTDNSYFIQIIFNSSPLQYLGRISYALYIVHFPVLIAVVFPLQIKLWGASVEDQDFFFHWKYYVVIVPGILLVLWVADLYWRFVDIPCVNLSHWVVRRLRRHY